MEFELDLAGVLTIFQMGAAQGTATPGKKVFVNGTELAGILRTNGVPGTARGTLDITLKPPPAGPVPIPYPNTSGVKRAETELRRAGYPNLRLCDSQTRKIKFDGKEIDLKGKSSFKSSTGDEAGTSGGKTSSTLSKWGNSYNLGSMKEK